MSDKKYRTEQDSMGELKVPEDALWGAQTQRAVENFPISGLTMPRQFIAALGLVKWAAAGANAELGLLSNSPLQWRSRKPRSKSLRAITTRIFRSMSSRPARARAPT